MQDRQLYEQILGLQAPWFVERVELKLENGEVHVYLEHRNDAVWHCPERGRESPLHDHTAVRSWRHLDTCQYRTVLCAVQPVTCWSAWAWTATICAADAAVCAAGREGRGSRRTAEQDADREMAGAVRGVA